MTGRRGKWVWLVTSLVLLGACSGESVPADSGGAADACQRFAEMQGLEVVGARYHSTHEGVVTVRLTVEEGGGRRCVVALEEGHWWLHGIR